MAGSTNIYVNGQNVIIPNLHETNAGADDSPELLRQWQTGIAYLINCTHLLHRDNSAFVQRTIPANSFVDVLINFDPIYQAHSGPVNISQTQSGGGGVKHFWSCVCVADADYSDLTLDEEKDIGLIYTETSSGALRLTNKTGASKNVLAIIAVFSWLNQNIAPTIV